MKMCFITSGRKFVEVANPGPRPEKPIEIYEFEGYITCLSLASNIFFSGGQLFGVFLLQICIFYV